MTKEVISYSHIEYGVLPVTLDLPELGSIKKLTKLVSQMGADFSKLGSAHIQSFPQLFDQLQTFEDPLLAERWSVQLETADLNWDFDTSPTRKRLSISIPYTQSSLIISRKIYKRDRLHHMYQWLPWLNFVQTGRGDDPKKSAVDLQSCYRYKDRLGIYDLHASLDLQLKASVPRSALSLRHGLFRHGGIY